jgi:hypothetical protein
MIATPGGGMKELGKTETPAAWSIDGNPNRQLVFQFDLSGRLTGMTLKEISPMHRAE